MYFLLCAQGIIIIRDIFGSRKEGNKQVNRVVVNKVIIYVMYFYHFISNSMPCLVAHSV